MKPWQIPEFLSDHIPGIRIANRHKELLHIQSVFLDIRGEILLSVLMKMLQILIII